MRRTHRTFGRPHVVLDARKLIARIVAALGVETLFELNADLWPVARRWWSVRRAIGRRRVLGWQRSRRRCLRPLRRPLVSPPGNPTAPSLCENWCGCMCREYEHRAPDQGGDAMTVASLRARLAGAAARVRSYFPSHRDDPATPCACRFTKTSTRPTITKPGIGSMQRNCGTSYLNRCAAQNVLLIKM